MLKYLKHYTQSIVAEIAYVIIFTLFSLITPLIIRYTVDVIIGGLEPEMKWMKEMLGVDFFKVGIVMAVITLLRFFFEYKKGALAAHLSEDLTRDLKERLFRQILAMEASGHDTHEKGDLLQRCTSDVETIRRFIGVQVVEIARVIFLFFLILGLMLTLHVKMTFVAMGLMPLIFASSVYFFFIVKRYFTVTDEAEARMTSTLGENIAGVRVVRAFGNEERAEANFDVHNRDYADRIEKLVTKFAYFWSYSDLITLSQAAIVLYYGIFLTLKGEMTLGTLIAFTSYEGMLIWPVRQLGRILSEFGKATVAIGRIDEILDSPAEEEENANLLHPSFHGQIRFENVSMSYHDGSRALRDVSFEVQPGETIGILGPAGSGKSSLLKVLMGLYPYEGRITLDGVNLREIDRSHLRRRFGMVMQESFLFHQSIKENIHAQEKSGQIERVVHAAEHADLHHTVMGFEAGYDTMVEERGLSLSGGQQQRVSLARTLYEPRDVYLFDDPLSAVDVTTESRILDELEKLGQKRTTLIVSHRLSAVRRADRLFLMEAGRLVAAGTHEELLKTNGRYRDCARLATSLE